MYREYISDKIINALEEIVPEGFKILISRGFVSFDKHESYRVISISLGDLSRDSCSYGPQDFISFYEIENILSPKFLKSKDKNDGVTIRTREYQLMFDIENPDDYFKNFPLELTNDQNIEKFKELVKAYIVQYSYPFFDYWTDWRLFLPFIENATLTGLHDCFAGYAIEKKLIIWKLCSHPKFELYKQERKEAYENYLSQNANDKDRLKEYKDLMNLLNKLEKIKPMYEWDDKYLIAKQLG